MLVVSLNAESDVGEVLGVGVLGLRDGRAVQLELAVFGVALSERSEVRERSSDTNDLVVLVAVFVIVVGDDGE